VIFFFKNLFQSIISKLIVIELYFRRKYLYFGYFGFADYFIFCLYIYKKKINKTHLCFTSDQYKICKFFFDNKKIKKSLFFIPEWISANPIRILYDIRHSSFFRPFVIKLKEEKKDFFCKNDIQSKNILLNFTANNKKSEKITDFSKKKYICIFVKYYNSNKNSLFPSLRQTSDLNKVYKIINFLISKKINILILGYRNELFVKKIEEYSKINNLFKNIFFFKNLSEDFSVADQIYIVNKSLGYIGSGSGPVAFFHYLKKKVLCFDLFSRPEWEADYFINNKILFYKKILFKNKLTNLNEEIIKKLYTKKNFELFEVSYGVIKKGITKLFNL
jgi:hypothetical protein